MAIIAALLKALRDSRDTLDQKEQVYREDISTERQAKDEILREAILALNHVEALAMALERQEGAIDENSGILEEVRNEIKHLRALWVEQGGTHED
jgi:hypothetical protein